MNENNLLKARRLVEDLPITVQLYDSGNIAFIARPMVHGERMNQTFSSSRTRTVEKAAEDAIEFCQNTKQIKETENGEAYPIPNKMRAKLAYHVQECEEKGLDPIEAIKRGIQILEEEREISAITFSEAAAKVIKLTQTAGRTEEYIRHLTTLYNCFGREDFAERRLSTITAAEIEDFLEERELEARSWNNWKTYLNIIWNFGLLERNKWVRVNVVEQVATKSEDDKEVTAFTVPQAKKVLETANAQLPRLMPFLVLGMFCGLRISEIERASWEDINWETKTVHAGKHKRKNSMANRHVTIQPVALAWLERFRKESGPFIETGDSARRADLNKLRELNFDFAPNIFRHSFGSYHNEAFKNSPLTAQEMGHTSVQMIAKHYRKPIPQLVAMGFWKLTPDAVL